MKATPRLNHFDLIAIGIRDEEDAREPFPFMLHLDELPRFEPRLFETNMLGVKVVDDDREMSEA